MFRCVVALRCCVGFLGRVDCLTAESVQSTSLAFQGVDHVHGGDGLPLGVLGVGDGIADDVLEEHLEDTAGLLVDESGDTLDTATTGQTADGGLGDALDVIAQDLAMTLGASLSQSLASFAASRHDEFCSSVVRGNDEMNEWPERRGGPPEVDFARTLVSPRQQWRRNGGAMAARPIRAQLGPSPGPARPAVLGGELRSDWLERLGGSRRPANERRARFAPVPLAPLASRGVQSCRVNRACEWRRNKIGSKT